MIFFSDFLITYIKSDYMSVLDAATGIIVKSRARQKNSLSDRTVISNYNVGA